MIDIVDDSHSSFSGPRLYESLCFTLLACRLVSRIAFLGIDEIGYLEIEGQVGFVILGVDCVLCTLVLASLSEVLVRRLSYVCSAAKGFALAPRRHQSGLWQHIAPRQPPWCFKKWGTLSKIQGCESEHAMSFREQWRLSPVYRIE